MNSNFEPLILTFDFGTQSIRALIFDRDGNLLAKEQKHFVPYFSKKPGYAEQKWEIYWDAFVTVSKNIHLNNKELVERIAGITITTIRDTCICLDKDRNVLRDIIVWLDQREAKCEEPLPALPNFAMKLVGMKEAMIDQRKITKSNWIIENEPDIWEKTDKYVVLSAYINYQLTGELIDSIANQVGHIPFDFKNKRWLRPKDLTYSVFNVDESKLIDIVEPGEVIGCITKEASKITMIKEGLPLFAAGADKECETLGSGVLANDAASLSFGTTATVQFSTTSYIEPQQFLPSYPGVAKGYFNPEIQIYRGYWMINWFKKEFAEKEVVEAKKLNISAEDLLNQRLKEIPAGSNGLVLQPFWNPMLKTPEARGSIIGFTADHTRVHIYRAIIEGIGYALRAGLINMEKRMKTKIKYVTVSGGGSQSDEICQITADMFNLPVRRTQTYEACGLGAAMVGFVSLGVYKNFYEAVNGMVKYIQEFVPNKETHRIYDDLFKEIYQNIYGRLRPLYKRLRNINKQNKKQN